MSKQLSPHFNSREFDCHDGTPVMKRDYAGLEVLCRDSWSRCGRSTGG